MIYEKSPAFAEGKTGKIKIFNPAGRCDIPDLGNNLRTVGYIQLSACE
jgi:hypothetical protein